MKVLLFGYGNIGRQDDGLGVLLAENLGEEKLENLSTDSNYQLNAEEALEMSQYDIVIFADASTNQPETAPYKFEILEPANEIGFTTHAMHPSSVLSLCIDLYKKHPETYLLTMPGYEWEFNAELGDQAKVNYEAAYKFIKDALASDNVSEFFKKNVQ